MVGQAWIYHDAAVELRGELYEPPGVPNGRAVLVVHEADGIGGNVRERCELLASLGYVAAAADMHGGGRVLQTAEIPPALGRFMSDPAYLRGRVHAAFAALVESTGLPPRSVAAIGYCFGGFSVLELARSGVDLAAVASFHGLLTSRLPAVPGDLRAPIFVATGAFDPLVPPADVDAFAAEMRSADADWHLMTHGRAYHSFSNKAVDQIDDPRMRYDPAADAISWAAALAFLEASFAA